MLGMPGVLEVSYKAEQDLFVLVYESVLADLAAIFAAVFAAGKKMGQEYYPEVAAS